MHARQSTAKDFIIGPVLDSSGVAVTTCVVGDFKVSKNGGAPAALDVASTRTHRHTGHYTLTCAAGDFDTVGTVQFTLDKTTDACAMVSFDVIEEAVYDRLYASGAAGYNTTTPPTTAAIAIAVEAAILDEGDATPLLAAIAAKVEEFLINDGDATATLAAIAAAVRTNLTTELARIDAAISSRNATTPPDATAIQAAANAALVANFLDRLFAVAYNPASKPGNAAGLLNVIVENDGGVPRFTENALEQGPGGSGDCYGPGDTAYAPVIRQTGGTPIPNAKVWISTDEEGLNVVAGTVVTDVNGEIPSPFMLDSGTTYYLWASSTLYNFDNPQEFTVP